MLAQLRKNWFLVGLAVVIPSGLVLGTNGTAAVAGIWPRAMTALVLFLMAFSLDSRHLRDSLRAPFPVLWASLVNYGVIPLLAWPLAGIQQMEGLAVGLLVAAAAPCTMAAASVWTRKAGGNDAVSLMVTLLTNSACFAIAPFWLLTMTGSAVALDGRMLVTRLLTAVLVPTILGQLLRLVPSAAEFATVRKRLLGDVAQGLILLLVLNGAISAGSGMSSANDVAAPGTLAIGIVWGSCIAVHVAAMCVANLGSRALGFTREDRMATLFAGSQKTLPVGLLLADAMQTPFAVFPILMYHASQLFLDTFIADRLAARGAQESTAHAKAPGENELDGGG